MAKARTKVYGGWMRIDGVARRVVVATTSRAKLAKITNLSLYELSNHWPETANKEELSACAGKDDEIVIVDLKFKGKSHE